MFIEEYLAYTAHLAAAYLRSSTLSVCFTGVSAASASARNALSSEIKFLSLNAPRPLDQAVRVVFYSLLVNGSLQ